MDLFDVHTHTLEGRISQKLVNIRYPEPLAPIPGGWYSIGVHPWDVEHEADIDWEAFCLCAKHPQVLAVGECGLDKCVHVDESGTEKNVSNETWEAQLRIFLRQAQIAEGLQKPLIVHNVRATDVLLSLRKKGGYTTPWMLHGFRGKPEAALQAVSLGFYLSFGIRCNEETLRLVPVERLLLETDDSRVDIRSVYEQAAVVRSVPVEELAAQVRQNIYRLLNI